MSNRRDVLVGIGAGLGVSVLAFAAAGRRAGLGHSLEYGFTAAGAPVGSLAGQPLKCTAGTVTAGQGEGPFYSPKTPERRDIRDPLVAQENYDLPSLDVACSAAELVEAGYASAQKGKFVREVIIEDGYQAVIGWAVRCSW